MLIWFCPGLAESNVLMLQPFNLIEKHLLFNNYGNISYGMNYFVFRNNFDLRVVI